MSRCLFFTLWINNAIGLYEQCNPHASTVVETCAQEQENKIYSGQHMPERQISTAKEWSTELEQAGNVVHP
jgi:hypothetical protein